MKKVFVFVVVAILAMVFSASGAVTHGTTMKNGLAEAVLDSCGISPIVVLMTAGNSPLDTVTLAATPFTRLNDSLYLPATRSGVAIAAGDMAKFKVVNAGGSTIFQGTVATSGGDLTVDNPTVVIGQTVNITSLGYKAAP